MSSKGTIYKGSITISTPARRVRVISGSRTHAYLLRLLSLDRSLRSAIWTLSVLFLDRIWQLRGIPVPGPLDEVNLITATFRYCDLHLTIVTTAELGSDSSWPLLSKLRTTVPDPPWSHHGLHLVVIVDALEAREMG